ncbi:hypothetical protein OG778_23765 [Streptomyces sp. NBC_00184]|uniref:hypothetical protein n=1 Tax=Streptomyces sp. NBC_00184 TaxID=2975673 RepID=UPI002E29FD34|nr:hypothetical protein [Streptomyces sp. NBC_00184]
MKLINAEENLTAEVTLNGQLLTVRTLLADGGELTGWNYDYAAEGFDPEYAAEAYAYEITRYERAGYAKV